ncbi:MAG: hypothetical protein ACREFN_11750 [Acetobacteraceae bacterium]
MPKLNFNQNIDIPGRPDGKAAAMATWPVQDAKARLSEVVARERATALCSLRGWYPDLCPTLLAVAAEGTLSDGS